VKVSFIRTFFWVGCLAPALLQAQVGFNVAGREVQVHGFLSEGFASSTANNYLRMKTSQGSFFTEGALNVSSTKTEKLRVGAQVYERDIGELGDGKVYIDWASADYHWKDWLGVRGGKVKTTLGLHTDTQDEAFLHTWALLPQSLYPADLRAVTIAHVGGDAYGNFNVKHSGSFSYTAFAGSIPYDQRGGYLFGLQAQGANVTGDVRGRLVGMDLRWNLPMPGLTLGTSLVYSHRSFSGVQKAPPIPFSYLTKRERVMAFYGQYTTGKFHADAEYRHQTRRAEITAEIPGRPIVGRPGSVEPAWFASAAYRLSKWMEVGSYYSHYHVTLINPVVPVTGPGRDHIFDKVATVRFDIARFWDLKIEGHFMDGVGNPGFAHGFYPQDNPQGLTPSTNMLVLRTSWYF
jgi:hypothetical protein